MSVLPNMDVFYSSLISFFRCLFAQEFSEWVWDVLDFRIITGIAFVFTFHMRCISVVKSLYFRIVSISFLITFLSPEIATYINVYFSYSLSRIKVFVLLLGVVLFVFTFPSWLFSTKHAHASDHCLILPLVPRIC